MEYLTLKEIDKNHYEIYFKTKKIGDFLRDVDGYFYFWQYNNGCWDSYQLKQITEKLDILNKELDEQVKKLNS